MRVAEHCPPRAGRVSGPQRLVGNGAARAYLAGSGWRWFR